MEFYSLGERMMIHRKRASLSKTELANICGVSVATISKYEDDKIANYNPDLLFAIASALDISVNLLIMGIKDPNARKQYRGLLKKQD